MTDPGPFIAELRRLLGPDAVSVEASDLRTYGQDWTRIAVPAPCAVAFPRSTAEVAAIVLACRRHGIAIVPSGGRTGLAAGAVAARGELALSLQRMRRMAAIDLVGQTLRVQAGVVTQDVHDLCRPHGLTWPIDLAAKGSSTIGGNVATNAGGVRVVRYGHARQWVLGLQVVTADGEILDIGGALEKDNSGLDLRQLFIGSEGTLGIITEVTLKLTRLPGATEVMLLAVADLAAALAVFQRVRALPVAMQAFEYFTTFCMGEVCRHLGVSRPLQAAAGGYVLVELETSATLNLGDWLEGLLTEGVILDGTRALSSRQAATLWSFREGITESLNVLHGPPHKNDVALPVAGLAAFVQAWLESRTQDATPSLVALFGHVGDGNLHINTLAPKGMDRAEFLKEAAVADRSLFALVQRHGGSISAEHGIGLVKKPYLEFGRSQAEIAVQRAVKRALDPDNRMNPGKIFDV